MTRWNYFGGLFCSKLVAGRLALGCLAEEVGELSLTDDAITRIRGLIQSGELAPGSRLPGASSPDWISPRMRSIASSVSARGPTSSSQKTS